MKRLLGIASVLLGILIAVAPAHTKTKAPKVDLTKGSVTGKHIKDGKIVVREGSAGQTTTDANKLHAVKGTHIPEVKLQARDASTGMATGKRQFK